MDVNILTYVYSYVFNLLVTLYLKVFLCKDRVGASLFFPNLTMPVNSEGGHGQYPCLQNPMDKNYKERKSPRKLRNIENNAGFSHFI